MMNTFTLDAEFENSNGKSHHFHFKNFDVSKTGEQIRSSLEKLTKLSLFEKDGVQLFKKVKHATVIEERVTDLFDDSAKFKNAPKPANDPLNAMMKAATSSPIEESVKTEIEPTPVKTAADLAAICIPEDLRITEERPKSDVLIQHIEFPEGLDPWSLDQDQAISLISACLPENTVPVNLEVDDKSVPASLIVTAMVEERAAPSKAPAANQSPPAQPKKKRKRLLDRVRRRE
ncbi:DUF2922 family protein [Enterococcus hulanensis]|uniref:DUF2922 family protein n=1 Tax=Enterococcus hulanensis TaxID=2559929 RepID=UPI0010F76742|nr:DUF2922 domain-containing protein [Enterococcus hulanensis]